MAIADAGTGTCQSLLLSTNGSAWFPPGIVTGGEVRDADAVQHRRGAGGIDIPRGTFFTPSATINFLPIGTATNSVAFITDATGLIRRANGAWPLTACSNLTTFYVRYGMTGTASGTFTLDLANCKAQSLTLECAVDAPLSATLEVLSASNLAEGATAPTAMTVTGNPWEWYHGSLNFNGTAYVVQNFSVTIENGLMPLSDLDAPGYTGGRRVPKRMVEGDETIRLNIGTANRIPVSVRSNSDELVDTLTFFAKFTNEDSKVLTISVSNLINASGGHPVVADSGITIYNYTFEAKISDTSTNALRITYA